MPVAKVIFQPQVSQGMLHGFEQVVQAIRPTLGPSPRLVALDRSESKKSPELLDNGGLIARRIIQLPDRSADVGAMFLRQALWRVHQEVGDGTATCAVIFEAAYRECRRYLAAGGNAALLRPHLEDGLRMVLAQLDGLTRPVQGQAQLAQVAQSLCYDLELAEALGEIFDILGPDGFFETRAGRRRELQREYVLGSYWDSELLSQAATAATPQLRAEIHDAHVLISDLEFKEQRQLLPVFAAMQHVEPRALLIVARQIAEPVSALLTAARRDGAYQVIAARTPGSTITDQAQALQDLGVMTGGRPIISAAGESLENLRLEDLGRARRAWADRNFLGIVGGQGDPARRRARLEQLRGALDATDDPERRKKLQRQVGRLLGGAAFLWVGAATEAEMEMRKALAERAALTLRSAMREGVVPGGGAALLACLPALAQDPQAGLDRDRRAAFRALHSALQAPFRTIVTNAGYDPSRVTPDLEQCGSLGVFDARTGQVVDAQAAGVWDAAGVVKMALRTAIASAALALTTDVIVHHKRPRTATEP